MPNPITPKPTSPVLRGNLMNIQEKIMDLRASFAHAILLQQQIQKAFFLIKENNYLESEKLLSLFLEIDCKGLGSYDENKFLRVQKEAFATILSVVGEELARPS